MIMRACNHFLLVLARQKVLVFYFLMVSDMGRLFLVSQMFIVFSNPYIDISIDNRHNAIIGKEGNN